MTVKVYSTPTCPYCKMAKEFLTKNNVEFEDIDLATDQAAGEELMKKSGQMVVPQIEIDGEIMVGFDEEKLKNKLDL